MQQECHSVLVKLHPITFFRFVFLGSAQFLGWMPLFVLMIVFNVSWRVLIKVFAERKFSEHCVTHILCNRDTPWHQRDTKPPATTKQMLNVCHYPHLFNHTVSTIKAENSAMVLDIVNGVNWSRKLTKKFRWPEKKIKANVSNVVINTFPDDCTFGYYSIFWSVIATC